MVESEWITSLVDAIENLVRVNIRTASEEYTDVESLNDARDRLHRALRMPLREDGPAETTLSAVEQPAIEQEAWVEEDESLRSLLEAVLQHLVEALDYSSLKFEPREHVRRATLKMQHALELASGVERYPTAS